VIVNANESISFLSATYLSIYILTHIALLLLPLPQLLLLLLILVLLLLLLLPRAATIIHMLTQPITNLNSAL